MSLTDEVRGEIPRVKRAWVEQQLGDECDEFLVLLADPAVQATALHAALKRRGIQVSARSVSQWCVDARKGDA